MAEHRVSFAPTEELDLVRSTARQYLDDQFPIERVRELMMSDTGFDRASWKELAGLGWTGLSIAEEHGGAGLGPLEMSVLLEEMGRSVIPGPFFASAAMATYLVQSVAQGAESGDLLAGLASGDVIATAAIFEKPRGWEYASLETTAERDGGGWSVSGRKLAVLDAGVADRILVAASTGDGLGVFSVDSSATGVSVDPDSPLDLTRRQAKVTFDRVPGIRLDGGDTAAGLSRALRLSTAALAAEQLGGAHATMEMAVEYAKTRYQFGRPIGSYQAIKHRCANMLMKVEHTRSAVHYAARVTHDDDELAVAAPLAGSLASETFLWVAGENIQVHGGIGFTWEHDAHIYLKRAKASSLLLGSPHHQRDLLGRAIGI